MNSGDGRSVLIRSFRWHGLAYIGVGGLALLTNLYFGSGWWLFWPLFAWGVALSPHFPYVKSVNVDDGWVGERAEELHFRSYDLGHIRDIEERVKDRDASVRPADERD